MNRLTVCAAVVMVAGSMLLAEDEPANLKLKIDRVSLFKNGLGYVSADGVIPEKATTLRIGQMPVPSYGTFWIGYSDDVKLKSMVTSMETVEESSKVQNVGSFLQMNPGKKVYLRIGSGEKDIVEGVIIDTKDDDSPREMPSPYYMGAMRQSDPYGRNYYGNYMPPPDRSGLVMVKTERGIVAVNASSVTYASLESADNTITSSIKVKRPSIRIELDKPAKGEKIGVSYLARGITWAPGYRIDLSDPKTAKFSASATVINELADLDKVKLELVTGFPNIKFGELISPTAMSQNLADFLNALAAGRSDGRNDRYANMMSQQAMVFNTAGWDSPSAPMPSYSTAAEGTVSEDLFLYPVKEFSLKRGETALLPLFTAQMPYKHIYTWKVSDFVDKEDRYRNDPNREGNKVPAEEVWHSCRLSNTMKMPLTTGAAEFTKDGQFTGQDICYYTAPGAETTIRINRAMNVIADQAEYEIERQRNAANYYGYHYDLVKVKGELKVRSRLDKPVSLEVTKELSGEMVEISDNAKDVQTAKGLKQVNPKHELTWNIEIKAGEEKHMTYVYKVYIRN